MGDIKHDWRDLFVSYRYWDGREREYRFTSSVVSAATLLNKGIHFINQSALAEIGKLIERLDHIEDVQILYWRRMEKPQQHPTHKLNIEIGEPIVTSIREEFGRMRELAP